MTTTGSPRGPLRAVVLTASVSRAGGGVYESARRLTQVAAANEGVDFDVLGLEDCYTDQDRSDWRPLTPRGFPVRGPRSYGYSPDLAAAIGRTDPDLAHVHGLWTFPTLAAARWARRHGRPYVVTIHGMMDPWALNHSRLKKRLALALFEDAVLRDAACLHVLNEPELLSVRKLGYRNPVCVIPNGVDLPDDSLAAPPDWLDRVAGRKVMLYLGRIHPKKGLLNLLAAWAQARGRQPALLEEWALVVAGWDQDGHEDELKAFAQANGLGDTVHFVGPQFGRAKAATFRAAQAFILPSLSEGLPMAVLEAWAHRLPVIMTAECNLEAGYQAGAAVRIETTPDSVAGGLLELCALPGDRREAIGRQGRALVEAEFSWPRVAAQMRCVYDWLTGRAPAPACVRFWKSP